ncbi:MAG: DNA-directed RNA polymerase subunit beta' [Dehalococcoidia bacterium]|nr:DNA-directed RNA polymerase subunit beta' [Dehalococcoidia bacterium]MYA53156.1 DNA-directed RNA polymerase subunit beta' [Dehalococcoidia bacterium]
MLEVNDFNQVRIGLASPSQIRSWSYGEVTKPETINYRTLKPEKDGLFCEKIFGPTKDFECYCGKYKRVRYKGIICDKCGVEVARAKVRRERMGHVELASPVSHIWFVKGTPSKLGLLLDISPRNLERVLYFAQYMITEVDDSHRDFEIENLQNELARAIDDRLSEITPERERLELQLEAAQEELEQKRDEQIAALERERQATRDAIEAEAARNVEAANEIIGELTERDYVFQGEVIVATGDKMTKTARNKLEREGRKKLTAFDKETKKLVAAERAVVDSAMEDAKAIVYDELNPLQERAAEIRKETEEQFQERISDLEDVVDPVRNDRIELLTETRYRELSDMFGHVFKAAMGAEAVLSVLERLDLDALRAKLKGELATASGQRRKKATKRLQVVEDLIESGNKPEWMIFEVLPVLPPELRPMVQLDGGRFATSDLNDLYRRVINRNNRLKRLLDLGAPEIIIRNEKRMLQEAVDSLVDNGRRGRAVSGSGNHKLKSLSDMLKGKQGRFRQNLLGKRVDYSGRSVIVVGPELKLHQCGLPKKMALELFKPFVMHSLVAKGLAHNIKSAKRIVERARPEVWDVLDEVITDRPVLLNRAPTLHRLGIQAFQPVLIEGSAVQLHPLVCAAFNADFDGDQMAVHVPLSREAVAEAKQILLSTKNLLSPASGDPTVTPTLDMVLGSYYMTEVSESGRGAFVEPNGAPAQGVYSSFDEAKLAFDLGTVDLRAPIKVRTDRPAADSTESEEAGGPVPPLDEPRLLETTIGRIIFNEVLPEDLPFQNYTMDRPALRRLVALVYRELGSEATAEVVDRIKEVGFRFATQSGVTIAIHEIVVPHHKKELIAEADQLVADLEDQYQMGLITEEERYQGAVEVWSETTRRIENDIAESLSEYGSLNYMASSGTKGNITQIRQMAGMRGLMADPHGQIIPEPIRASFREGLTVLEYFISTHGARKGLADTALRTADSGYLTRRLIDVSQDVIIGDRDCDVPTGLWIERRDERETMEDFRDRIVGRYAAAPVADEATGEVIVDRNEEIDEAAADRLEALEVARVYVRTPMSCESERGICQLCYGRDLARGELVRPRTAVGIIAAQSIGEPGTQLTMRTFHTGGVAGTTDITSGLPRVEELFEARAPKGEAIISEIDGVVEVLEDGGQRLVRVSNVDTVVEEYAIPAGAKAQVAEGDHVVAGSVLAAVPEEDKKEDAEEGAEVSTELLSRIPGIVRKKGRKTLQVVFEDREDREYSIPAAARLLVGSGEEIEAGAQITEGAKNPQHILSIQGRDAVRRYMVDEVQKVYRSQGVNINDKHIEVITRQMLRRVRVDHPGDTGLLPGDLIDRREFEEIVARVVAEGGEPATAQPVLLGVTKASLNTNSWLAAASFQETTRVLTNAAVEGKVDKLVGLKENVIIGKLIPARAEIEVPRREFVPELDLPESLEFDEEAELERMLAESEAGAAVAVQDPDADPLPTLAGEEDL